MNENLSSLKLRVGKKKKRFLQIKQDSFTWMRLLSLLSCEHCICFHMVVEVSEKVGYIIYTYSMYIFKMILFIFVTSSIKIIFFSLSFFLLWYQVSLNSSV